MDDAEQAYEAAKVEIARMKTAKGEKLVLSGRKFHALRELPPQIAELENLRDLNLAETEVSDLTPISGLSGLRTLYLNNTPITDLSPLRGLKNLEDLTLDGSQVADLRPIADLVKLGTGTIPGLSFKNTEATDYDPILAEIATVEDYRTRAHVALEHLRGLPHWPKPYGRAEDENHANDRLAKSRYLERGFNKYNLRQNELALAFPEGGTDQRLNKISDIVNDLRISISDIELQLSGNLEAINKLDSIAAKAAKIEKFFTSVADKSSEQDLHLEAQEKGVHDLRQRLMTFETDVSRRIEQANTNFEDSMSAATAAFSEANATAAPVQLWSDKQAEHETSRRFAFWAFIGGLVSVVALTIAILWVFIRARGHSGFPTGLNSDSSFQNGGLNERRAVCVDR